MVKAFLLWGILLGGCLLLKLLFSGLNLDGLLTGSALMIGCIAFARTLR